MSKKEEKPKDEGKADAAKSEKGPPDEVAEARKKRKLVMVAGISAVFLSAAAAGGFFVYKTFVNKDHSMAAKKDTGHEPAKAEGKDEHGHGATDDSGHAKTDGHADAKQDGHSDAKQDGHSDAKHDDKSDPHSDKKDESKDAKKDPHASDAKNGGKDSAKGGTEEAKKDEKSDIKLFQSDESFGETFALPKMDLNLGNPLENRYLRIGVSIEYTGGKNQQEEIKKREPQLRDIIISSVSTRTRLELLTDKGKEKLRRELVNKINESFERPIKTIYFTDFLVE